MSGSLMWISILMCVSSVAASGAGVLFVDSPREYLRKDPDLKVLSPAAVAAASAALLGVVPPSEVDSGTALQLQQLLHPDVFRRPRAVLHVFVAGVQSHELRSLEDPLVQSPGVVQLDVVAEQDSDGSLTALALENELSKLAGEGVALWRLDCRAGSRGCDGQCVEEMLQLLAGEVGGAFDAPGTLTLPSGSPGEEVSFHTSQPAERTLLLELVCFLRSAQRDAAFRRQTADLLVASFSGLKVLKAVYGAGAPQVRAGGGLMSAAIRVAVRELQQARQGRIVGSVLLLGDASLSLGGADFFSSPARVERQLQDDVLAASSLSLPERAVVWLIAIIAILALLLGNCALFTMPLTKDTLLYAGVKLD